MTEPIGKPFAGYASFADCVKQNSGKSNPQAYCATIQRQVEKLDREFAIVKLDEDNQLAFGWASVSMKKDGETVVDSQGDKIAPDVLEGTAYRFVLEDGDANTMHTADRTGRLVESFVVTPEKLAKMGLAQDALPIGWWVGFHIEDAATWDRVKKGELRSFSIEGTGERVAA